ncbi:MAG: hypothetical protein IKQ85_03060, partial [Bacteroidaceae bacterium]|nr:hypothetical protein [Bacteroidaceae bacterium]
TYIIKYIVCYFIIYIYKQVHVSFFRVLVVLVVLVVLGMLDLLEIDAVFAANLSISSLPYLSKGG